MVLNLGECLVGRGLNPNLCQAEQTQWLSPSPTGDWLSLPATQGASIQMPVWHLGQKGCVETFLRRSPGTSELVNRGGADELGVTREGTLLLWLMHCFPVSGKWLPSLWLTVAVGEMVIQTPRTLRKKDKSELLVLAGEEGKRREGQETRAQATHAQRTPSPDRHRWLRHLYPLKDPH